MSPGYVQVKKADIEQLRVQTLQMKEYLPQVINKNTLQSITEFDKCQQGRRTGPMNSEYTINPGGGGQSSMILYTCATADQAFSKQPLNEFGSLPKNESFNTVLANENFTPIKQLLFW